MTMEEELQIINEIEKAALLCEKEYSHSEIIDVIKTENDFEKQICLLKMDKLQTQAEADLLVFQLTGHHGLIREACAMKINEFVINFDLSHLFLTKNILESLLKGVNDINPNICRLICSIFPVLFKENTTQKEFFIKKLYERFFVIFEELEKLKRSNWYTKKLFNLYWCLEALALLEPPVSKTLENILQQSATIRDYTIREKTAFVLSVLKESSQILDEIKNKLKNDENFYVLRYSQNF